MSYSLSYHQVDHSKAFDLFLKKKLEPLARLKRHVNISFVVGKSASGFEFSARVRGANKLFRKSSSSNLYEAARIVIRRIVKDLNSL